MQGSRLQAPGCKEWDESIEMRDPGMCGPGYANWRRRMQRWGCGMQGAGRGIAVPSFLPCNEDSSW